MNRDITLLHVVEHLSVVLNTIADEESRVMRDQTDWMPQGFSQESTEVGPTGGGHVCRFFSWRPDPEAEALDAFNQDWGSLQGRAYANPLVILYWTYWQTTKSLHKEDLIIPTQPVLFHKCI